MNHTRLQLRGWHCGRIVCRWWVPRAGAVGFLIAACFVFSPDTIPALREGACRAAESKPRASQRLLDRTPFDRVVLNAANGNKVLEVLPLSFPQGGPAQFPATGALQVRLLERPTEEFEIAWSDIAQVRVFEQVLLDEAARLTQAGQFDEAYDYYARLLAGSPQLAGLQESINEYLRLNALALYKTRQHDRALALLLTLHERAPDYPSLPEAVERVAGEIMQKYLRDGDFGSARRVLQLWQTRFRGVSSQAAGAWQSRFESAAGRQLAEANSLLARKEYVAARRAANRALAIWPDQESAKKVLAQVEREFPYIAVGVFESAPRVPSHRLDNWASLRTSRLVHRLFAEEVGFGAEGGEYQSAIGAWQLDDDGQRLALSFSPVASGPLRALSADAVSRALLECLSPGNGGYRKELARLVENVSLGSDGRVELQLKQVHVRPESLLRFPLPSPSGGTTRVGRSTGPYSLGDATAEQVAFIANEPSGMEPGGPQAILEQTMPDDDAAIAALINGDIDVLDRVPPWQLARLRNAPDIRIEPYKLPTVHVLVPNMKQPLVAKREFRRALCYGIDREWIVHRVLLAGSELAGFQAVSGPFPAGVSLSDPIWYGYNGQVAVRPFEPRLASILATVAWAGVQNPPEKEASDGKGGGKESGSREESRLDAPMPKLVLAHPRDAVARLACQSIEEQLARVGISVQLVEFSTEELVSGKVECDLRYAELTIGEPLTDAHELFSPPIAAEGVHNPYLEAALRNLSLANNWKDVRARLAELHDIVDHELPVIPLWQTVNSFAYRTKLSGVGESPVTLYQNIEHWVLGTRENVAKNGPAP
ncbi:MAG: hypothetical protein IT425_13255 [Pirellulales bacterium]|nr:hypothetical protein [Pirellulales bacterium]